MTSDGGNIQDQGDGGDPAESAHPATRWRIAAACVAVAAVLAGGIGAAVAAPGSRPSPGNVVSTAPSSTSSSAGSPATRAMPPEASTTSTPQPTVTVPPAELASEKAELQQTAVGLTRLRLSSPASWDQWLPQGKPYPGASTADDISTCPAISSRLTAALGKKISYWIGTLPVGPNGCDYATVPLDYNGPYTYPYTLDVGYLSGTTTEAWRHHFYEHQGAICPDTDVSAVAPGAVLVRCVNEDSTGYTLVLPDSRRPDGVWFLEADTRPTAQHPASYALTALLDALKRVYS